MRFLTTTKGEVINVEAIAYVRPHKTGSLVHLVSGREVKVKQAPRVLLEELFLKDQDHRRDLV